MNLESFMHQDWTKIWAGTWSFLSCSHFGIEYTRLIRFNQRPFINQSIIFVETGKSNCWATQSDRDILGKYLAGEIAKNPDMANKVCNSLKSEVDTILHFIDRNFKNGVDPEIYQKFWQQVVIYYHPHIFVKYVVDYLTPELLKIYLPYFEDARKYAEPVFKRTEDFIIELCTNISKKINIPLDLVLCLLSEEIENYLLHGIIPLREILEERNKNAVLFFDTKNCEIFVGEKAEEVKTLIFDDNKNDVLRGITAFGGKVKGIVRIVLDPFNVGIFSEGDILVAGMTRPEYLPMMKKAAAIVTDAGGVLCHAAIVARELKKPCIIGTMFATRELKDGDKIEVDADRGIIKIIR